MSTTAQPGPPGARVAENADGGPGPAASAVEQHGYDFIPESERYLTPRQLGFFWAGINSYQFFFVLGAGAIALGLSLLQAVVAVVLGNALFGLVAYSSIAGPRAGLPALTLSRAPFGVFGNRINALFTWAMSLGFKTVNGLLGVFAVLALFDRLGWHHSGAPGKILATLLVLGAAIVIAVTGHRLLVKVQPYFAVVVAVIFALLLCYTVGGVDWHWQPPHHSGGGGNWLVLILSAAALIASGSLSYLVVSPDYARYLPSDTPVRKVFPRVLGGGAGMAVYLGIVGVLVATRTDLTDPVAGVQPLVPAWLYVLYIAACFMGSISNNASVFYSSGLAVQAVGIPLKRWLATALDATLALAAVLLILFVYDFETALNDFLSLVNVWAGPFAAVWIVDGILRRWHYDQHDIHTSDRSSRYWGKGGVNVQGLIALVCGMGTGLLSINSPLLHGWLSGHLGGADVSWFLPILVSGAVYLALAGRRVRGERATA
ncbi:cytosine permease [Streptomyces sp. NBC_01387]|uniref:purine-cytosine permease family protein n=1 Tax=unclassified Streptomyces TaxID=2593676 RepID=UPI0020242F85|nr:MULTISPECIES: cytosine permease [unclassified Streptomyces]MCX4551043.1 cytosine permease [Streptomyces sp. NBC_01500]WSC22454.1 cytosine permease [Streptomyces sp. NBC_01766]WSV56297.1 cytosine permease [Streptomyces sp. NBC_01014]